MAAVVAALNLAPLPVHADLIVPVFDDADQTAIYKVLDSALKAHGLQIVGDVNRVLAKLQGAPRIAPPAVAPVPAPAAPASPAPSSGPAKAVPASPEE